ncbi:MULTISPECIES: flagellar basal body-associated protein FliL [Oceanobacillus]|uniref:flagellar basal body-associated protein FliL n=1 Tax=Oceanobacillus TaxID=182709 RepID=UPI0003464ECE|nr:MULTISPECIES: flagellar basal body-associated protein FliL [Oceanobacillus]MBT2598701.1 flagellar basal body-associated protein FliL [Oceanobacillus sp. ISL-74]MBT2651620.1 flagellar basal body-associated protein FliL [Oceanobacillus sp. ISL-73]MCT1576269.1 flagellar basal body-associated protein FliL [Oceanobacillus kimchii]MCT2135906.1 flagellar basal body-associated protein FliL [Oceanobacillus kimchii]OEH54670.1 flagellar basal body-associated protein FliL [Oceanobacillus sp. E9]
MSKLMKTMITSLVILLAGAITALVIVINISTPEKVSGEQSIDDMVEYSFESPEVTTDLEDGAFVRVQFQIIADSSDAKKELEKRDFQLKNILIKELAKKNKEDFQAGLGDIEEALKNELNNLMTEGNVTEVYTISKILQ